MSLCLALDVDAEVSRLDWCQKEQSESRSVRGRRLGGALGVLGLLQPPKIRSWPGQRGFGYILGEHSPMELHVGMSVQ